MLLLPVNVSVLRVPCHHGSRERDFNGPGRRVLEYVGSGFVYRIQSGNNSWSNNSSIHDSAEILFAVKHHIECS